MNKSEQKWHNNNYLKRSHIDVDRQNIRAQIKITDEKGSAIKVYKASKGSSQLSISKGELAAGAYNYTLYVNDKIVDTKKMVITK